MVQRLKTTVTAVRMVCGATNPMVSMTFRAFGSLTLTGRVTVWIFQSATWSAQGTHSTRQVIEKGGSSYRKVRRRGEAVGRSVVLNDYEETAICSNFMQECQPRSVIAHDTWSILTCSVFRRVCNNRSIKQSTTFRILTVNPTSMNMSLVRFRFRDPLKPTAAISNFLDREMQASMPSWQRKSA